MCMYNGTPVSQSAKGVEICVRYNGVCYIRVLFHTFHYYVAEEYSLLYWGLRYIGVRYITVYAKRLI